MVQIHQHIKIVMFMVIVLLFVVMCEKKPRKSTLEHDLVLLGQEHIEAIKGGAVKTSNGVTVEIPPNALSANTIVKIYKNNTPQSLTSLTFLRAIGDCYRIDLGEAAILDSAKLTLPYVLTDTASGAKVPHLTLAYRINKNWIILGGSVDSVLHSISVRTTHFSDWIVFGLPEPHIESKRLNVPYYEQRETPWCVFTSMAMIGKYYGNNIENYQIAQRFGKGPGEDFWGGVVGLDGLTGLDILLGKVDDAYQKLLTPGENPHSLLFMGLCFNTMRLTIENCIVRDMPVLLLSAWYKHAFVIVGYDQENVYIHDPSGAFTGGDRYISCKMRWSDFELKVAPWLNFTTPVMAIVSLYPVSNSTTRRGTIQIVSCSKSVCSDLVFLERKGSLLFAWDGRNPLGYYFKDYDNVFPDDPNLDGSLLINCPTSTSFLCATPHIMNITEQDQTYRVYAKIFTKTQWKCVYNSSESEGKFVKVPADSYNTYNADDFLILPRPSFSLHKFSPGAYYLMLYLKQNGVLQDSVVVYFNLAEGRNLSPTKPTIISGQSVAYTDEIYSFSATAEDPDGDRISFRFSWDNDISEWSSDVQSGGVMSMSHSWTAAGTHTVRVQAKDVYGAKSTWSEFQTITIKEKREKEKQSSETPEYSYPAGSFDVKIRTSISTIYIADILNNAASPEFYIYFSSNRDAQVDIKVQALGDLRTPNSESHFGENSGYIFLNDPNIYVGKKDFDNSPRSVWSGWVQANEEQKLHMGPTEFPEYRRMSDLLKSLGTSSGEILNGVSADVKYVFYIIARDNSGNVGTNKAFVYLAF